MSAFFGHWMVHALGWTLLHFCWQGAGAALLLWCCLRLMDGRSSRVRYGVACVGLGLMVVLPLATFGYLATAGRAAMQAREAAVEIAGMTLEVGAGGPLSWTERMSVGLDRVVPVVLELWLAGAVVFLMRLQAGLAVARRLRWMATSPVPAMLGETFTMLRQRMGVTRPVRLLQSALVHVPTVVGWLKPVVLVPASCFTGLSEAQIEAVLCHELAHVLRHDYLVSVAQSVVEALLFYHPAVWWISKQVRRERECCCDELAVKVGGDALGYARALQYLEARRSFYPEVALGANGGVLTMRIKRLLGTKESSVASQMVATAVLMAAAVVAATSLGAMAEAKMAAPAAVPAIASTGSNMVVSAQVQPALHAALRRVRTAAMARAAGVGSLGGTVVDSTGAVIADARVTVTNTSTGVRSSLHTNAKGGYVVDGLEPGAYTIEAAAPGFQTTLGNIRVDGAQGANLNLKLDVGSTTTTVDVVGQGVAQSAPAVTKQNLAEWMNRHGGMTPEQQQKALESETGFRQLSAPSQARLRDQLRQMNSTRASLETPKGIAGGGQETGLPMRVSGGVMAGQLISRVDPVYPPEAKAAGVQGAVVLKAIISKEGTIQNLQVVSGPQELGGSALDAVKQWVYKPFLLNGEPTEVMTTITVNYMLSGDSGEGASSGAGSSAVGSQKVAAGMMAGQLVSHVPPVYPDIAKASGTEGAVTIKAVISKTGRVQSLHVLSGPEMLRASALDAVKQWVYKPYLLNGQPTEVETTITVNYSLGAAPASPGDVPKKIGNGVSAPVPLSMVDPSYTEAARKAKVSGNVLVSLWVDEKGDPSHVTVTRSLRPDLDRKAVEAVSKYKFKPAMEAGKPVTVAMNVEVNFQIF